MYYNTLSWYETAIKEASCPNYSGAFSIGATYTVTTYGWVYVHVRGYSGGRYQIRVRGRTFTNETSDGGLCSATAVFRVSPGDTVWWQGASGGGPWFIPDK